MDNQPPTREDSNQIPDLDPSPLAEVRLAIMELIDEGLIEVTGYTDTGDPLYAAVER